jgi:hypothetical protein
LASRYCHIALLETALDAMNRGLGGLQSILALKVKKEFIILFP